MRATLHGTLGKDRSDSPLGNALSTQQLVKRNRLTGKPAHDQILGDRAERGRAPDVLPLPLGDFVPESGLKLGGNCPRPLGRPSAAVKVPSRHRPRFGTTLRGRTSHYIGVHFHPNPTLFSMRIFEHF
jgi:hypothetical protein